MGCREGRYVWNGDGDGKEANKRIHQSITHAAAIYVQLSVDRVRGILTNKKHGMKRQVLSGAKGGKSN